jgi:hypothetical protein
MIPKPKKATRISVHSSKLLVEMDSARRYSPQTLEIRLDMTSKEMVKANATFNSQSKHTVRKMAQSAQMNGKSNKEREEIFAGWRKCIQKGDAETN